MKLSTRVPGARRLGPSSATCGAGTAGRPTCRARCGAAPNVEYFAPWFRSEAVIRSMPYEQWKTLSPHGQRISRYVMCGKGEKVIGAGYIHPRAKMREAFKEEQLRELGPEAAEEYLRRL